MTGLLLPKMIVHVDDEWQQARQRPCRLVVGKLGGDLTPIGRNANALLSDGRSSGLETVRSGVHTGGMDAPRLYALRCCWKKACSLSNGITSTLS